MVTVGLPAKSGVTGGILALLPGQLGIAVFSPPLDARGNSVRGVQACRELSRDLELHFLRAARPAHVAIGARHPIDRCAVASPPSGRRARAAGAVSARERSSSTSRATSCSPAPSAWSAT